MQPIITIKAAKTTNTVSRWAMLAALGFAVSGCSSMPDIPNPLNAMSGLSGKMGSFLPHWSTDAKDAKTANADTDSPTLVRQGDAQRDGGNLDVAVKSYTKAVVANPTSLTATLRLAQTLVAMKRYDEGRAAYRAAQNLAPQDPEIAFRLGELELTRGETATALVQFKLALASRKDDAKLYNAMGVAYATQGQTELALQSYNQGLAINPDYPALRNNYGLLQLATGDLNDAVVTFEKLVQVAPSDRYRINLALVYTALGRDDDAQKAANGLMDQAGLKVALSAYYQPPAAAPIAATTPAPAGGKVAIKGKLPAKTPSPEPQIVPAAVTATATTAPGVHFGTADSNRGPTLWTASAAAPDPVATGKPIAVLPDIAPAAPAATQEPSAPAAQTEPVALLPTPSVASNPEPAASPAPAPALTTPTPAQPLALESRNGD